MTSKFPVNPSLFFLGSEYTSSPLSGDTNPLSHFLIPIPRYAMQLIGWLPQTPKSPLKMDTHFPRFLSIITFTITISSFLLITLPMSHGEEDDYYMACNATYSCGKITNISYPFWGQNRLRYCGSSNSFELKCDQNDNTSIEIGSQNFTVISINQLPFTMRLVPVRGDLLSISCPSVFTNTSLNPTVFRYNPDKVENLTLFYNCPQNVSESLNRDFRNIFTCYNESAERDEGVLYVKQNELREYQNHLLHCGVQVQVPVSRDVPLESNEGGIQGLKQLLELGFDVQYYDAGDFLSCAACNASGGMCGSGTGIRNTSLFSCYCRDGAHDLICYQNGNHISVKNKVIVGVCASGFSVLVMLIAFVIYQRRKKMSYAKSYARTVSISSMPSLSLKDTEKGSKYFGLPVFTYDELEEATNHFDFEREIGDGGFGTVYFGKLRDGRYVAVKRLYEKNYRRLEQFKTEIEILTRLRHQNLVSLYGCTSRHSRELLLVYEYIPNGTLADHLHGERAKAGTLSWDIRMNIAIETASAIAYLHASDIIHRDVKSNNMLLDNHFTVKVADFGLSRPFPDNVTHISTTPQGTPGYMDPEYHEYYQLTNKSDVYSFGVVLIELISSMPAVDITRHRHEINLSNMAISKIQSRALHEIVDPNLGFESDYRIRKEISAVAELAFQCLQSLKDMRPSMEEVLERLKHIQSDGKHKGNAEEMDISADDAALLKNEPPPASPDSNLRSTSTTTPNDSR